MKEFFESIKLNLQDIELDKVDIDLTMMLEQIADELYGVLQEKMLTCKVEAEEEILIEEIRISLPGFLIIFCEMP